MVSLPPRYMTTSSLLSLFFFLFFLPSLSPSSLSIYVCTRIKTSLVPLLIIIFLKYDKLRSNVSYIYVKMISLWMHRFLNIPECISINFWMLRLSILQFFVSQFFNLTLFFIVWISGAILRLISIHIFVSLCLFVTLLSFPPTSLTFYLISPHVSSNHVLIHFCYSPAAIHYTF